MIKLGILRYLILLLYLLSSVLSQCCQHSPLQSICQDNNVTDISSCNNWCANVRYNITNDQRGIVDIEIDPPCYTSSIGCYKVKLYVQESVDCRHVSENDLTEDDPDIIQHDQHGRHRYVHSEDCFRVNQSSDLTQNCSRSIRLQFNYLFNGCYRLRIEPKDVGGGPSCFSNLFQIQSSYKKYLIPTPSIDLVKVYKNEVEVKNYWFIRPPGTKLDYVKTSLIGYNNSFYSYHCEKETGDKNSYLSRNDPCPGLHCDEHDLTKLNESCHCEWYGRGLMNCHFYNLKFGLYKILVEARDIRCETLSLWRDFGTSFGSQCLWYKDITVEVLSSQTLLIKSSPDLITLIKHNLNIIIPAILAVIISILIAVLICCKYKRTDRTWYQIVPQLVIHRFHSDVMTSRKVLILYPRDCPPFMEAMKIFRNILERADFKVMDPLDPNIYEDVAISNNTWGFKYLSDPTVKVILAASWCSLKLEEGILTSNPLIHSDRLPFDTIFTTLLNQLYLEDLPYKKIYVVRLDGEKVGDLRYKYIASCRNFTLPQCTQSLIHQLLELPVDTVVKMDDQESLIKKLDDSIKQYNSYLRDNPHYLASFLTPSQRFNNMIELKTFDKNDNAES